MVQRLGPKGGCSIIFENFKAQGSPSVGLTEATEVGIAIDPRNSLRSDAKAPGIALAEGGGFADIGLDAPLAEAIGIGERGEGAVTHDTAEIHGVLFLWRFGRGSLIFLTPPLLVSQPHTLRVCGISEPTKPHWEKSKKLLTKTQI